jgi:NAD(P)-dependent dehydrogenase (short-subunit alcohol dehydrogenase family)
MPGTTRTEGSEEALAKPGVEARVSAQVASGRIGEVADIADFVATLVSDSGRWATGQCIAVSGGQQL